MAAYNKTLGRFFCFNFCFFFSTYLISKFTYCFFTIIHQTLCIISYFNFVFFLKAKVETEVDNLKKALEGTDIERIREATEKLTQVFYELSEKLYKQANPNAGAEGAQAGPTQDENGNVYDADYNVESDNNNQQKLKL